MRSSSNGETIHSLSGILWLMTSTDESFLSESLPPDSKNENDHPGVGLGPENTQTDNDSSDNNHHSNGVYIMNRKPDERATSFFAQPGILAAVIGGAVVGLLCAILVVMFIVYRMRKKDEGSYALDEPKRSPTVNSYTKNSNRDMTTPSNPSHKEFTLEVVKKITHKMSRYAVTICFCGLLKALVPIAQARKRSRNDDVTQIDVTFLDEPPNWCESSGKTHCHIEGEGCDIIQGHDLFLSYRAAKLAPVIRETPLPHRRPEINLCDIEGQQVVNPLSS
uniref:Syndecan n=1 Tax=Timema tahoe TaxID=61484 RepID=A0A7R9ILI2_9NEOP|nr:unnamed protein product [Timema tahoe]